MMKFPKSLRCTLLAAALLASFGVAASEPDDCVDVSHPTARPSCTGGLDFKVRNKCNQPMDIRVCLERTDKSSWNCGVQLNVKPNHENNWLTCPGTGEHRAWARSPGMALLPFPEEKGDFRQSGGMVYSVAPGETAESACRRANVHAPGSCECEARSGSIGFRCRVKIDDAAPELASLAKPFGSDSFRASSAKNSSQFGASPTSKFGTDAKGINGKFTSTGSNETEACANLRRMAGQPGMECACKPAGNGVLCRAEGSMPAQDRGFIGDLKGKARELLDKEKPKTEPEAPSPSNGGSGRRG